MSSRVGALTATACAAAVLLAAVPARADAVPVELKRSEQGWQLLRDSQPYFIRGAGGEQALEQLAAAGGNSIRTWGSDDLEPLLDRAHALGLTVTVGIWLGHERHGFDYDDDAQVAEQFERARRAVLRYREHPALLLWGVGNEMEGFEQGDNPAIWKAVNDIAAMIKRLDPLHPTMTVTAEIGGGRIASINELCPAIDIHGINSYGGAPSLPERYRKAGGTRPYVLTEFGPPGQWESPKNAWGAPEELTSTQKAERYRSHHRRAIEEAPGMALGAYAFTWGFKMEATPTWFGLFLPDGARLGAVDVLTEIWSGSPPDNLAPQVEPLRADGNTRLQPGQTLRVKAAAKDPEGAPLRVRWELQRESGDYATGGDFRRMLPAIEGAIVETDEAGALVRAPRDPGPYRLYMYAYDDAGNAATANLRLWVNGEVRTPMPVDVYRDGFEGMPWVPSGWMGAMDELEVDGDHRDNPQAGDRSIRMRFTAEAGWVGVAWQHPANNWGKQDGGFDLRGASTLEFWARGEYGGERIGAGVGLLGPDTDHPDSARAKTNGIVLTTDWQRYTVPLADLDLSSIKTGFYVTMNARRSAVTIYLDSIRYVR